MHLLPGPAFQPDCQSFDQERIFNAHFDHIIDTEFEHYRRSFKGFGFLCKFVEAVKFISSISTYFCIGSPKNCRCLVNNKRILCLILQVEGTDSRLSEPQTCSDHKVAVDRLFLTWIFTLRSQTSPAKQFGMSTTWGLITGIKTNKTKT